MQRLNVTHRRSRSATHIKVDTNKLQIDTKQPQTKPPVNESKEWLTEQILHCKQLAQQAVLMDNQHMYRDALSLYKQVYDLLSDILYRLNKKDRHQYQEQRQSTTLAPLSSTSMDLTMVKEQLIKTRKMYADRTTAMLSVLPPGYYASCSNMQPPTEESSYSLSAMTYADVFQSIMHMDIKQQWNQPPIDEGEQLFVFLQRVSNSIWRGDYITGMVYLTPLVWTQPGVRLVGIETKTHELGLLLGPLQRLKAYQESDPDCQNLVFFDKAIEEFEPVMEQCKQQIFKKFKYQDEKDEPRTSTNSNRLRTLSMRIQKSLDVFKKKDMEPMAHYRTTLASFLGQSADIFLRWLKLTHDPSRQALHIKTRLLKIVSFYDHVVYPLVVNDIQILVERFIKKMRKEASI